MAQYLIEGAAPLPALDMRDRNIHMHAHNRSSHMRVEVKAAKDQIGLQSLHHIGDLGDIHRKRSRHRGAIVFVFCGEYRDRRINLESILLQDMLRLAKFLDEMEARHDELELELCAFLDEPHDRLKTAIVRPAL